MLLLAGMLLAAPASYAQEADSTQISGPAADSVQADVQAPLTPERDPAGQTPTAPSSDLKAPITFSARDSLIIVFGEEDGDAGTLFGQAAVDYDDARLNAFKVSMLFERDELQAEGLPSDTGLVGRPTFNQANETFYGHALAYNMRTERGRVVEAETAVPDGEGTIRGGVVKVLEDSTVYAARARYTTCDCIEDPSYSLRSQRMKVRGKWLYSGPIQLFIFNIPTPLWLPFGFLPAQEGRRSGPLPPTYGEDERGFYLRDWGWYWAMNDYMDLQIRGGIWTRGSWQVAPLFRYNRRYHYNGQLHLDYVHNRRGESRDPDFTTINTASIRWNHSQTISPSASFSSNVNLSTQNYLRTVSEDYDDRVRQTIQSSMRYSKRWGSARSLNVSLSQNQQLATGQVNMTLPNVRFSQRSFQPFDLEATSGQNEQWFERITTSYSASLDNAFTFNPTDTTDIAWYEALVSPSKYREATGDDTQFDFKATHTIPISAPFSISRLPLINRTFLLNVSPNFNYTEDWFIQTTNQFVDEETGQVITEQDPGFFALRQFTTGVSANTTIYGLFPVRVGPYNGVRHTLRPNLSFSYRPDFGSDFWGYVGTYRDTSGNVQEYNRVQGVQRGLSQTMSFSLSNVFETKRVEQDTTGEERSRTLKLFNLDLSTGYNFAADSLKLSDISMSGRTRLFGQVDVTTRASFSPYQLNDAGTREINKYVAGDGLRLARLTSFSVTARTSIRSRSLGGSSTPAASVGSVPPGGMPPGGLPPDADALPPDLDPYETSFYGTAAGYANFDIPWSLNFDVSYNLNKRTTNTTRRATFNVGFDFNATPNWKVQGRTGYDFERKEVVSTNLSIVRDFECWQMSFSWVPFGAYQSYSFSLQVKSGPLRDILRLRQPRADVRGRFNNLIQ